MGHRSFLLGWVDRDLECSSLLGWVDRDLECSSLLGWVDRDLECSSLLGWVDRDLECTNVQQIVLDNTLGTAKPFTHTHTSQVGTIFSTFQ